jgi:phage terminase large subunit-like protein
VAGEDAKSIRESLQPMFMGPSGQYGTGLLPGAHIQQIIHASGTAEMVDTVTIKSLHGGLSRLVFKSYAQERESFQASRVDVMQFDEEPPMAIYTEGLTRTMSVVPGQPNGLVICGFTPLKGLSGVVLSYVPGGKPVEGPSADSTSWTTFIAWEDVPHLDKAAQAALRTAYLPHELKARTQGIPALGAGAIYPIDESEIVVEPFQFPAWYRHAYGMDVGWNKTAAIWGALDPETDVLYLYSEHYRGQAEPEIHAGAIKARGVWIPGVIDPAARGRGQGDGQRLLDIYRGLGLVLVEADNSVESGLYAVWSRLSTGRLKVFRTLQNFLTEYRIYRRDENGRIVKAMDHLADATRYLCLSGIGTMTQAPPDLWRGIPGNPKPRTVESDYNPFAAAWAAGKAGASAQRGRGADGWMPGRPLR